MSTKNSSRFTPVIIAISVVIGILIGTFYAKHFAGNRLGIINGSSNKLNALLRIVDDQYVDTVNMTDLVEKAMPQILAELDPHSTYIPAQNLEEVNSELEGSFSGIGIQFTIQNDTIHVNAVIQGGPSEKVGLMAGDRIVTVDDSLFVGKKVTNERAMRTLKGPKGSQVKLGVKRMGEKDLLSFTITRGDIPQNTVDAAYMLNDEIGYVKVSKFGRTSHVELLNALAQLNHKKCKGLIIDLRGNTGGYMEAAIRMVNEFLPEGKLIVYTQGRKYPRAEEFANGTGSCQKMPLVVSLRTACRPHEEKAIGETVAAADDGAAGQRRRITSCGAAHPREEFLLVRQRRSPRFGDEPRGEHLGQEGQIGTGLRDELFGTAEVAGCGLPLHRELTQGDFHIDKITNKTGNPACVRQIFRTFVRYESRQPTGLHPGKQAPSVSHPACAVSAVEPF